MKKISFVLLIMMLFSLFAFQTTFANDEIKVFFNGEQLSFTQPPVIINDRTLVPMRAIFEALGAEVSWDAETRTASGYKEGVWVFLTIDSPDMLRNYVTIPIDVPATIINNSTMIPLRVVSECFGMDVQWNGDTKTITITDLNTIKKVDIDNLFYYWGEAKDNQPFGYGILYDKETNRIFNVGYFENEVLRKGVSFYTDGSIMRGTFDELGRTHGYAIVQWASGSSYEGNCVNGKKDGYGVWIYKDGAKYEGNWSANKMNGYGIYYFNNGDRYEGNWLADKKDGYGTYYFNNGDRYEGNWLDDKQNGVGIYYFADGSTSPANFNNGVLVQ